MNLYIFVTPKIHKRLYAGRPLVHSKFHKTKVKSFVELTPEEFYKVMDEHLDDFIMKWDESCIFGQMIVNNDCTIKMIDMLIDIFEGIRRCKFDDCNKIFGRMESVYAANLFKRDNIDAIWTRILLIDEITVNAIEAIVTNSHEDRLYEIFIKTIEHLIKINTGHFSLSLCLESIILTCMVQNNVKMTMHIVDVLFTISQIHPHKYVIWSILAGCDSFADEIVKKYCTDVTEWKVEDYHYYAERHIKEVKLESVIHLHDKYMEGQIVINDEHLDKLFTDLYKSVIVCKPDALAYLCAVFPFEAVGYKKCMIYVELLDISTQLIGFD